MMIESDAVDYRTGLGDAVERLRAVRSAPRQDGQRQAKAMGLLLAGWDFKLDADGRAWCLEANAMPGYSSYDRRLGGSISKEVLRLMGSPIDTPATVLAGAS